jgi:hypothetical protein
MVVAYVDEPSVQRGLANESLLKVTSGNAMGARECAKDVMKIS